MGNVDLGGFGLSENRAPYVIAEIGVNHECNMALAKKQIELAKEGGAHAAKFQSYKAEKLASVHSPAYWDLNAEATCSQRELFSKFDKFGEQEYLELADHCSKVGIDFLSTPFDLGAVDFLDDLMPFFKVASADLTNIPLLRKVAAKKKPVVLSTGASDLEEIRAAVAELHNAGANKVVLLHCVLNYPCDAQQANLLMIKGLQDEFPHHQVGYSDHTKPTPDMDVVFAAWLLGASVIEKHFTHDKTLSGNDHYHAMDVHDLKRFMDKVEALLPALGQRQKRALDSEAAAILHARRSIVADCAIAKGEVFTEANLTTKRPGHGIPPTQWDLVIGKQAMRDIGNDEVLTKADVQGLV